MMAFSISTIGMMTKARPMAIAYSLMLISAKPKAWESGVSMTTKVRMSATAKEPQSHRFCFLSLKMDLCFL